MGHGHDPGTPPGPGPCGQRPTATLTGTPPSPTAANSATITVGGTNITPYKYSLVGGNWSAATPIATPITLTNLAAGSHTLAGGGTSAEDWQATSAATTATWTVVTSSSIVPKIELLLLN